MRYFEMFAGVGGFGLGIQRAYVETTTRSEKRGSQEDTTKDEGQGLLATQGEDTPSQTGRHSEHDRNVSDEGQPTCVGFSEIDPHASNVLRYHYPYVKNYGDCTKINWSEVPDFDLLVGGSPCQDFSIAGKRAGLVGARSGLAYEYIRALEEKRPAHFIWENVRGVLSSNKGWDFGAILNQMAEAGYSLQWQVLNAKHFGVPQNRERVFVIGTRQDGGSPREVFFEQGTGGKGLIEITRNAPDAERVYDTRGIGRTLKGLGGGEGAKTMLINETNLLEK
jgi:DNA (cytosine-5)-methyltransferase 1